MKNSIATLATAATLLAATFNQANAKGTDATLSQTDWNTISDQIDFENATEIAEIPVILYELTPADWKNIETAASERSLLTEVTLEEVNQTTLKVSLKSGKATRIILNAPFTATEMIGVAVIDASGNVVSSMVGAYANLQDVQIPENRNETYVVRVYSATQVYETKVQVVYL